MTSEETQYCRFLQYCTFQVDQFRFGIDVRDVQEVLRHQPLTPVPLAPPVVSGLINLRGRIVMAVNLRERLKLPVDQSGNPPVNIIVRADQGPVSFLVDAVREVVHVPAESLESPPDTMSQAQRELISGCFQHDDFLLVILDTRRLANVGPHVEAALQKT